MRPTAATWRSLRPAPNHETLLVLISILHPVHISLVHA
jgi:hypothetical protein